MVLPAPPGGCAPLRHVRVVVNDGVEGRHDLASGWWFEVHVEHGRLLHGDGDLFAPAHLEVAQLAGIADVIADASGILHVRMGLHAPKDEARATVERWALQLALQLYRALSNDRPCCHGGPHADAP